MRKNISNKVILAIILFSIAGCKAKKELVAIKPAPSVSTENHSGSERLKAINSSQLPFTTLSIKAMADLTIGKDNNDVTMNIRMKNKEIIWISITKSILGEIARAIITPDSLKVINRLDNTYSLKPFNFIKSFTNDQINFNMLQAILAGNAIKEFSTSSATLTLQDNQARLEGILSSLNFSLLINERNKVISTTLKDNDLDKTLEIKYADFYSLNGFDMPYSVKVTSTANNKHIAVNLKYVKTMLNESSEFPFTIPSRYSLKK